MSTAHLTRSAVKLKPLVPNTNSIGIREPLSFSISPMKIGKNRNQRKKEKAKKKAKDAANSTVCLARKHLFSAGAVDVSVVV